MISQEECSRSFFKKIDCKEQKSGLKPEMAGKINFSGLAKTVLKKDLIFKVLEKFTICIHQQCSTFLQTVSINIM